MQTCTTRDSLFSNGDVRMTLICPITDICKSMISKALEFTKKKTPQAWLVADVIMYVVTEGLILAFFHCDIGKNSAKF
jgi:hypothetical protein